MERIRGPGTGGSQTVRLDSYRKVFFVSPNQSFGILYFRLLIQKGLDTLWTDYRICMLPNFGSYAQKVSFLRLMLPHCAGATNAKRLQRAWAFPKVRKFLGQNLLGNYLPEHSEYSLMI